MLATLLKTASGLLEEPVVIFITIVWVVILFLAYFALKALNHYHRRGIWTGLVFIVGGLLAGLSVPLGILYHTPKPTLIYPTGDISAGDVPITLTWSYPQPDKVKYYEVKIGHYGGRHLLSFETRNTYLRFHAPREIHNLGLGIYGRYKWEVVAVLRGLYRRQMARATFTNYGDALKKIAARGRVRFGVDKNVQHGPFVFYDGQWGRGFDIELMHHICSGIAQKIGKPLECEAVPVSWAEMLPQTHPSEIFLSRDIDACISEIIVTEERERAHPIKFSKPYYHPVREAIISLAELEGVGEDNREVTSLRLEGNATLIHLMSKLEKISRVGVSAGSVHEKRAEQLVEIARRKNFKTPRVFVFKTLDETLRRLAVGSVDAVILDEPVAIWEKRDNNFPIKVVGVLDIEGREDRLGIMMPSGRGYKNFRNMVNRIIEHLESGESNVLGNLKKKYGLYIKEHHDHKL